MNWNAITGKISTHTLTWSVTVVDNVLLLVIVISTHTLTWSVTLNSVSHSFILVYFNSHAHVERDPNDGHAIDVRGHFNSHAHVERDCCNG